MLKKEKISKELEEQIQSFAGDIYIQIEDKIVALLNTLSSQGQSANITDETVEQHQRYQRLLQQKKEAQNEAAQLQANCKQAEKSNQLLENEITRLKTELTTKSDELSHHLLFKEVKLSNTEQTLSEKLDEISLLKNSLKNTTDKEQKNREQLFTNNVELSKIEAELARAKQEAAVLLQKNQANAVSATAQNHQISALKQQLDQVNAEFDRVQIEKNQQTNSADQSIQKNQESIQNLTSQLNELTDKLAQSIKQEKQISKQLATQKIAHKTTEENLTQKQSALQKTINEYESTIDFLSENEQQQADEIKRLIAKNTNINQQYRNIKSTIKVTDQQTEKTITELKAAAAKKENLAKKQIAELSQQQQELQTSLLDEQTKTTQLQQQYDKSFNEQSTTFQLATDKIQKDFEQVKNKLIHEEERGSSKSDKYEKEANNARDTIKYLRDENFELQTKLTQQTDELKAKITEYRLRFEYAQKQLSAQN